MESLQIIKNRIQNIIGTRQITKSMKLVSTIKVQKVRTKMTANHPFLEEAGQLLKIAGNLLVSGHPYTVKREVKRSAVVVISSGRGLCGGYNVNVGRETLALIKSIGESKIITVGAKARDFCRRRFRNMVEHSFTGISENPFYDDAEKIASILLDWYNKEEVDQVYVVYTQFENMLIQHSKTEKLLPMETDRKSDQYEMSEEYPDYTGNRDKIVRCELAGETFFHHVAPFYMTAFIYGAILESSVCEQSARAANMDAAVKNAGEMIDSLTLLYNQARQGEVTQEIIEIVSGADAVN